MAAYPRKQTLFIFLICALLVGGVAFYVRGQSPALSASQKSGSDTVAAATSQDPISTGTDWQKQFLNGATSSAFKTPATPSKTAVQQDKTATDRLNEGFFTKYAELSKAGLTGDPKVAANVMGQVASSITAGLPSPETYNITDISVSGGTDKAALALYQQKISSIFKTYIPKENEAVVADQAFTDNDMSQLSRIDPIIAGYKSTISNLLKVPVPAPIAQTHLDLINGFSIALYNSESLRHMDTDPVRGLAAISLEAGGFQNISAAASGIQTYLTSAGIPPTI